MGGGFMVYGYARVSTKTQERDGNGLDAQLKILTECGAEKIFTDTFTGIKSDRPDLQNLLETLASGDTLVVTKLDRIARSLKQGNDLVNDLINRGIKVNILNIGILDNSPSSKLIRSIFFAFAEFERDMIVERTQEGKAIAKTDPNFREGRPKLYKETQLKHALELLETMTFKQVENLTGISKSTLVRARRKKESATDENYIAQVKAVPISNLANDYGFTVIPKGNKYLSLLEHDSVIIDTEKNCFWRNSKFSGKGSGGAGSVIDFALEFGNYTTPANAIKDIANKYTANNQPTPKKKSFILPPNAKGTKEIHRYLIGVRKINESVFLYFLKNNMLYQDDKSNCVFVSNNFACLRGTHKHIRFVQDISGSDYNECFFIRCNPNNKTLIVAESVIDVMSIMSKFENDGKDFLEFNYLAICGLNKLQAIFNHIGRDKNINTIMLAFDNDAGGLEAMERVKLKLTKYDFNGTVIDFLPPKCKDWNEYLVKESRK
jgi:DNA invertase Pin-like site-specific DNA recombinase